MHLVPICLNSHHVTLHSALHVCCRGSFRSSNRVRNKGWFIFSLHLGSYAPRDTSSWSPNPAVSRLHVAHTWNAFCLRNISWSVCTGLFFGGNSFTRQGFLPHWSILQSLRIVFVRPGPAFYFFSIHSKCSLMSTCMILGSWIKHGNGCRCLSWSYSTTWSYLKGTCLLYWIY